jgi:DNA-directed RNA polymerase specialized sigma24 family protein
MAEYVNNKRFAQLINEFHERRKTNPDERIPEEIGRYFIAMSEKLASRYNFAQYTYRDEFVSDGILRCVQVFKSFDPTKSANPFAYFTKVLYRSFIQRIKKEKTERQVRDQLIMIDEIFCLQDDDDCKVTRDQVIGDYQFDSSSGD